LIAASPQPFSSSFFLFSPGFELITPELSIIPQLHIYAKVTIVGASEHGAALVDPTDEFNGYTRLSYIFSVELLFTNRGRS